MNYYAAIYTISIIASLVCGGVIFQKYRNLSGLFFLLFTCLGSTWFALYFLFFSGVSDVDALLLVSRLDFGVWVIATYSLFFFVYFFDTKPRPIWSKKLWWIFSGYLAIILLYVTNKDIITGLVYSPAEWVYRETTGSLFPLHIAFYCLGAAGLIFFSIKQIDKQVYLNKIRFKHIVSSASLLISAWLVFQLILPALWIWIFEQELIVLYAFFTAYTLHVLRRYYFPSSGYGIGRIFIFVASIIFAIVITYTIKLTYWYLWDGIENGYWWSRDDYSIVDISLWVALSHIFYALWKRFLLTNTHENGLKKKMYQLEQVASYATSLPDLQRICSRELKKIFKTRFSELRMLTSSPQSELRRYFENDLSDKIFIRDIVFMEEQKTKFHPKKLLWEIPEETFLIVPIFQADGKNVGAIMLGVKPFEDFYTMEEIDMLKKFAGFLDLHIKYIGIYEQIRDLSVNLDKKVDEKTMEYNDLLNKQKEFISLVSHEVKSPIANAVFQVDSILDDLENFPTSIGSIKKELRTLNSQLQDTGELLSKLFSVQYYDTHDVSLFREKVRLGYFLQTEYEVYSRMHEDIHFLNEIDPDIGFVEIDRIQFQQVISNLLNNAVKFRSSFDATIRIHAHRDDKSIRVCIEDNGRWFQGIDISELFTRYGRGGGGSVGLGLGLYLCKKIIDMHHGEINASVSESLGGARFDIRIPVQ